MEGDAAATAGETPDEEVSYLTIYKHPVPTPSGPASRASIEVAADGSLTLGKRARGAMPPAG